MRKIVLICTAFALGSLLAHGAIDVTVVRVEESRSITLVDDKVSRSGPELTLTLSLTGPEAEAAVRYGDVKIEEATDDTGANLLPKKSSGSDARFKDFANAFFRKSNFGDAARKPAPPQVNLNLATTKRSAQKIARLRGSFSVATAGTIQTVELTDLTGGVQKTVPVPEAAHLTITAKADTGANPRRINVDITGDESAIESLEIVDSAGKKVSSGMSSWSMNGGPAHRSLDLMKPLDNMMKLVAKIAVDRKVTQVPFDLKDITLP